MGLYKKRFQKRSRKKSGKIKSSIVLTSNQLKIMSKKVSEKDLAVGVAIHTNVNSRTSYSILTGINDYSNPNLDNRGSVVVLSRQLRRVEGICASVADLLADFAITRGHFYSDNDELKFLLNDWADFVNSSPNLKKEKEIVFPVPGLRAVARRIFDDYITDGDSIFTLFWKNNVKMDANADGFFLPVSIKSLDVLNLTIDSDLAKLGIERIELKLSDQVTKRVLSPTTPSDKFLKDSLPKEWIKFISKGDPIILDPNATYHLKRNGKDYKAWGESLFVKAFAAVANKRRLQAVDDATIDGLINRFTIFKLGLADREKNPAYHIPSKARMNALIDILTDSKRTNAAVWPGPDLDVIDIGPDGKILEFDQKYRQADIDILRALHVPPALIDGTSGSSTQAVKDWMAFVSTEVGLDAIRNEFERVFSQIGQDIAVANKMDYEKLYYKFDTQLLKNEQQVRTFALKVYELGGLSVETFVKTMGYDFTTEKTLKEKEKGDGTKELFVNENIPGFTGVQPGADAPTLQDGGDGRPVESTKASVINIERYENLYKSIFAKILKDADVWAKINPDDLTLVEMSLTTGFAQFERLVISQLKDVYTKYSGGNYTKDYSVLEAWNNNYIRNFYKQLISELELGYENFINYVSNNQYRIAQYAKESFVKAMWLGKITQARLRGEKLATWECTNENSACKQNDGKQFSLDFLALNFPGHPNCNCIINFTGNDGA